jgi:hypothetical protein
MTRTILLSRLQVAYVALLLVVLAAVQLRAEAAQLAAGYLPFVRPPVRVAYSWDMFAIRLDRCAVTWDPPLWIEGRRVAAWRDRVWPIEFDSVYNDVGSYAVVAQAACAYRSAPATRVALRCDLADGSVDDRSFDCP